MALLGAAQEKPDWESHYQNGTAALSAGRYADAMQLLAAANEEASAFPPQDERRANTAYALALCYHYQGQLDRAETLYLQAEKALEAAGANARGLLAFTLDALGQLRVEQRRWEEAEKLIRQAIECCGPAGEKNPCKLNATGHLGDLYFIQGRIAEAEVLSKDVVDELRRTPSVPGAMLAAALRSLAGIYEVEGRYSLAEPLLKESLALTSHLGESHPAYADTLLSLGRLYRLEHDAARAAPLLKKAIQIYQRQGDACLASVLNELGMNALDGGKFATAREYFRQSTAIYQKVLGPENVLLAFVQAGLAEAYLGERNYAKAESLIEDVLAKERMSLGDSHYELARAHMVAAKVYQGERRNTEADANYRQALSMYRQTVGADHPDVAIAERQYRQFSKSFVK